MDESRPAFLPRVAVDDGRAGARTGEGLRKLAVEVPLLRLPGMIETPVQISHQVWRLDQPAIGLK